MLTLRNIQLKVEDIKKSLIILEDFKIHVCVCVCVRVYCAYLKFIEKNKRCEHVTGWTWKH